MIYRAEETSLEMNEALDHVIAALGRQIRRNKTRLEKAKKVDPNIDFPDASMTSPTRRSMWCVPRASMLR